MSVKASELKVGDIIVATKAMWPGTHSGAQVYEGTEVRVVWVDDSTVDGVLVEGGQNISAMRNSGSLKAFNLKAKVEKPKGVKIADLKVGDKLKLTQLPGGTTSKYFAASGVYEVERIDAPHVVHMKGVEYSWSETDTLSRCELVADEPLVKVTYSEPPVVVTPPKHITKLEVVSTYNSDAHLRAKPSLVSKGDVSFEVHGAVMSHMSPAQVREFAGRLVEMADELDVSK